MILTGMVYEGRDAYSLVSVDVQNYFREITEDMEAACYGSYFLEFADYYGRENLEAVETLKLLYQSLRALLKSAIPNRLVRAVFELKLMDWKIPRSIHGSTSLRRRWKSSIPLRLQRKFWKNLRSA